jgi:F-type H+-transporting ATPase subunit delta
MKNHVVAERYARALSASIDDVTQLEPALKALQQIADVFESNHALHNCLANPAIHAEQRKAVLDQVMARVDVPPLVVRFVHELLDRRRLVDIPAIVEVFARKVDERLERVSATVTSAQELNATNRDRVRRGLESFAGKTVRAHYEIDPSLICGVVARLGDTVIDGSLRTRLNYMKTCLLREEN